ncbi:MAG: VWA domain-containing protein [Lentisphaeria bacterium]
MHFQHLDTVSLLVGLAVLAAAAVAAVLAARGRRRVLAALARPPLAGRLVASLDPGRRRLRQVLFFTGLCFLLLALARPWWGTRLVTAPRHSRDLLFAVDVSRSMLARDVPPSRLEHAKWFVREVARRSPGDRFGLIAFAGDAMLECPLTQDLNTLFQFLDTLDTRSAAVGGTNLAKALDTARRAFSGAEGGHRAVILLSDGEELEGQAAAETARFKESGVPLFVVGVGDPVNASMIQLGDGAFVRDAAGKMVATKLNEAGLRALAEATGGIYVRSTALDANVAAVEARVKSLVPAEHAASTRRAPIERFQWPLMLGLLCLLARLALGERRETVPPVVPSPRGNGGRRAAASLLAGCCTAAGLLAAGGAQAQTAAPALAPPAPAKAAGTAGADPAAAAASRQRQEAENRQAITALEGELAKAPEPQKARLHYNLGCRCQAAGDAVRARKEYEAALAAAAGQSLVRGFAQQNLGVLRHSEAREQLARDPQAAVTTLEAARQWYREALRLLPGNELAGANLERLEHDLGVARQLAEFMKQFQKQLDHARQETAKAAAAQVAANQPPPAADPGKAAEAQAAASRQTRASQQAVDDLVRQSANSLKPEAAQQFRQAAEEVRQAAEAQQRQDQGPRTSAGRQDSGREAEQHLRQAVKLLGGEPPPPSGQPPEQQDPQKQQKQQDQQNQQGKQGPQPPPNAGQPPERQDQQGTSEPPKQSAGQDAAKPAGDASFRLGNSSTDGKKTDPAQAAQAGGKTDQAIDPNQAAALMQGMMEQEKELREAIKEQRRGRLPEPEKDW